jgi:hypothetical protein
LALWPGTSRSLVTIVAALLIGVSMEAAVEFSFLLGFVTLTAATLYETAKDGRLMLDTFGLAPLLGLVVRSCAPPIKWLIKYLSHHGLAIFGWYRIALERSSSCSSRPARSTPLKSDGSAGNVAPSMTLVSTFITPPPPTSSCPPRYCRRRWCSAHTVSGNAACSP